MMLEKLRPKTLFLKLLVSYLVVILATLAVLTIIMSYLVEEYFYGAREWEVNTQAREVASMLQEPMEENNLQEIMSTTQTLSRSFEAEIAVFDEQGDNITIANYYSEEEEETGDVDFDDDELNHVLDGNSLTKKLVGPQAERLLIAIPVYESKDEEEKDEKENGENQKNDEQEDEANNEYEDKSDNNGKSESLELAEKNNDSNDNSKASDSEAKDDNSNGDEDDQEAEVIGTVSLNVAMAGIEDTLANISRLTLISGGIAVVVAGIFSFTMSKHITRPLSSINKSAQALANGDFTKEIGEEVLEESDDELGKISRTFHLAAKEIETNIEEQKRLAIFRKNLVDNASHEFRAPLSAIRGYSELIIDDVVPEKDQKYYLNLIWKNSVELNQMVDTLLDLSSLESGTINLDKKQLVPKEILSGAMEMVAPDAEKKQHALSIDSVETNSKFLGEPHRIKQILVNLLKNAIQYTPEGGKISLRTYEQEQYVALEVADNGVGIPDNEKPRIFQRFYKVDKSRNQNKEDRSTGLGLAIVNELVKLHGGKIQVASKENVGSTFTVFLPKVE